MGLFEDIAKLWAERNDVPKYNSMGDIWKTKYPAKPQSPTQVTTPSPVKPIDTNKTGLGGSGIPPQPKKTRTVPGASESDVDYYMRTGKFRKLH